MIPKIETFAYQNKLNNLPPDHKLLVGLLLQLLTLFAHPLVQFLIIIWLAICLIFYAKIPFNFYVKLLFFSSFFLILSAPAFIFNISINEQNISIYLDYDNLSEFIFFIWRSLASISCLLFIVLTTSLGEIILNLEKIRFPLILRELLILTYRFIFILFITTEKLILAQKARGGYNNKKLAFKSICMVISQLFKITIINYQQFYLAVMSRGFSGEFKVINNKKFTISVRYIIEFMIVYLGLICLNFWLMIKT